MSEMSEKARNCEVKVKTHPLGEIIACKLFSIERCPPEEQRRMVNRCFKAAIEYHDRAIAQASREGYERGFRVGQADEFCNKTKFQEGYQKGVEDAAKVAEKFDRRNDPTALRIATAIRELSKPKDLL